MESDKIKQHIISSAEHYLSFLEENNKGYIIANVLKIERSHKSFHVFSLTLDKDISRGSRNNVPDARIMIDNRPIPNKFIRLISFDKETKMLKIGIEKNLADRFERLKVNDIKAVVDIRFLIKNLIEWHSLPENICNIPRNSSIISRNDLFFCEDMLPSSEQLSALHSIFSSKLSYVWGAPGTGKTQCVLAYAVAAYVKRQYNVILIAPTNNSLEQALYGIIRMLKKLGLSPDDCITREGVASEDFSLLHPNICQNITIENAIGSLEKELETYDIIIKLHHLLKKLKITEEVNREYIAIRNELQEKSLQVQAYQECFKKITDECNDILYKINIKKIEYNKVVKPHVRIFHNFFNNTKYNDRLSAISNEIDALELKLSNKYEEMSQLKTELKKLNQSGFADKSLDATRQKLLSLIDEINGFTDIVKYSTPIRCIDVTLRKELQRLRKNIQSAIHAQFGTIITENEAMLRKANILAKINELSNHRTKQNPLRAMTIDHYIATRMCYADRVSEKINHIFLDEACYVSLAKASVLLSSECPVTLLGDHKQLPPVCEMNIDDFTQENKDVFLWSQSSIHLEELACSNNIDDVFKNFLENNSPKFNEIKLSNLTKTHRFGENLSNVLDSLVYKNGFSSTNCADTEIYYICVPASLVSERRNLSEAKVIASRLAPNAFPPDAVAVLTPYKNQKNLISSTVLPLFKECIMTVHASQGSEWETVFFSVSDPKPDFFTNSRLKKSRALHLINTAVSRARKRLIIVCNYEGWIKQDGQYITELLKIAKPYDEEV